MNTLPIPLQSPARGAQGFTLVELLVVIVISTVLMTLAVPSFRTLSQSQAVRTASFDTTTMLMLARSEALKRNTDVTVQPVSGDWKNGWTVSAQSAGNPVTLAVHQAFSGIAIAGPSGSIAFNPLGHMATSSSSSFEISAGSNTRCVLISLSGVPSSKAGACS
jgi:type IV fimbrial biogenesis protein FimT